MAGETTFAEVSGVFKKVYDPKVLDLRPKSAVLQRMIEFNSRKRTGESYNVSVMLKPPNGFTYAGSSGAVATLKQARNMVIKQATISSYELDLREQLTWKAISSAVEEGEGAFKDLTREAFASMTNSIANRVEASMLHGQRGYGTVESVSDGGSSTVNVVISAATWSAGLWWAMGQTSTWDSFTGTTKNNATASGALVLNTITTSTRTLNFTHAGVFSGEVAAGDVLYPEGAYDGTTHTDLPGLLGQCSNTSGTSLGLSATTYINWGANTYAVGSAPISHGTVELALAQLRDRGAQGRLVVLLSNKNFSVVAMEVSALRIVDNASPTQKLGVKAVSYQSIDVGDVEIINHPFMKDGEFLILPIEDCERVGSSDITNKLPGMGEEFVQFVNGSNVIEFGNYSDQAVICKRPNHSMVGTGIVN